MKTLDKAIRKIRLKTEQLAKTYKKVFAVVAFVVGLFAVFSFEEAFFNPVINFFVSRFGDQPMTYIAIFFLSLFVLVVIFGKNRLPFPKSD